MHSRFSASLFALFLVAACGHPSTSFAQKNPEKQGIQSTTKKAPVKNTKPVKGTPAKQPSRAAAEQGSPYGDRADAMRLADDIAARRDLSPDWVRATLAQARLLPQVQRFIAPAPRGVQKNWRVYRSRFVEPIRIQAGVRFWQAHRDWLAKAEAEYGVPPEMVVGIIGVETIYGREMGSFRVLDALATLTFDFPTSHPRHAERQAFFQGELEQYLSLCQRAGLEPGSLRGSFAGAMGMPQFMPSSWVKHAVDFDGDGKIDLFGSVPDVIGSVANYFKAYGWVPGQATHYPVAFDLAKLDRDTLLGPDILPTFNVAAFTAKGAVLDGPALQHPGPLALVELQNGNDPPSYVAGTQNFYTITRYNWSSYYAMAVIELGAAVAKVVGR